MSRVFLDPGLLLTGGAAVGTRRLSPGAADALAVLADAGHEVVVIGDLPAELASRRAIRTAVAPSGRTGWLVTGDRRDCERTRRRGLRTILVGPHLESDPRPTERCDREARDLPAAALVILATEAMGDGEA
jgi:hypothetical protein